MHLKLIMLSLVLTVLAAGSVAENRLEKLYSIRCVPEGAPFDGNCRAERAERLAFGHITHEEFQFLTEKDAVSVHKANNEPMGYCVCPAQNSDQDSMRKPENRFLNLHLLRCVPPETLSEETCARERKVRLARGHITGEEFLFLEREALVPAHRVDGHPIGYCKCAK